MELTLVGLQYSGKTTFVNVIAVSAIQLLNASYCKGLAFYSSCQPCNYSFVP